MFGSSRSPSPRSDGGALGARHGGVGAALGCSRGSRRARRATRARAGSAEPRGLGAGGTVPAGGRPGLGSDGPVRAGRRRRARPLVRGRCRGVRAARPRRCRARLLALDAQRSDARRHPDGRRRAAGILGASPRRRRGARGVLAHRAARGLRRHRDHDTRRRTSGRVAGHRSQGLGLTRRRGGPVPRRREELRRAGAPRHRHVRRRGVRGRRVVPHAVPDGALAVPPGRGDAARGRPRRRRGAAG